MRDHARRVFDRAAEHPVVSAFVVAFAARLTCALLIAMLFDGPLMPDEALYMAVLRSVVEGRGADQWYPGYGQAFYDSTWAFSAPLALLFKILWPARYLAQLYTAFFGAATAALVAMLAGRVTSRRWSLVAGLTVALLPSQVLWSSVVLRESIVWACLAAVAVALAVAASGSRARLGVAAVLAATSLLALSHLRVQTLVVAAWSLALAAWFGRPYRVARGLSALTLAAVVPWAAGLGPLGWDFVKDAAPALGTTRTYMSLDADSALVQPTAVGRPVPGLEQEHATAPRDRSPGAGATAIIKRSPEQIVGAHGERYRADNSAQATIGHVGRGLVAVIFRPAPFERPWRATRLATQAEMVGWYGLYVLAGVGVWLRRRQLALIAFPVLTCAGISAVGAVTQGNLGTAFRHRGQTLWALAFLAVLGAEGLLSAARSRKTAGQIGAGAPLA